MISKFVTRAGSTVEGQGESPFQESDTGASAKVSLQDSASSDKDAEITTLVVSPNLSMSWRANLMLVSAIAFICLGTGLVWAWFGLWLVLPFAGLEVLFVTWCLYLTVRKLTTREVITIGDKDIKLEWGREAPQHTVTLPRYWSKLSYECTDSPFEVGTLTVGAHGKSYPLGQSLGRDEKRQLYQELHSLI